METSKPTITYRTTTACGVKLYSCDTLGKVWALLKSTARSETPRERWTVAKQ